MIQSDYSLVISNFETKFNFYGQKVKTFKLKEYNSILWNSFRNNLIQRKCIYTNSRIITLQSSFQFYIRRYWTPKPDQIKKIGYKEPEEIKVKTI